MAFKLQDLLIYEDIVIQSHNIPDADTLASAYGLYCYFSYHKKHVQIVYGGPTKIAKDNMKLMLECMNEVDVKYVDNTFKCKELLITVDCQYGAANVDLLEAPHVAIVDHHQIDSLKRTVDYECILSSYGSCSSVVYQLLVNERFPINTLEQENKLSTLLYYGIYMDTCEFSELRHPADRDARDELVVNDSIFVILQNNNLSLKEMQIIGSALNSCYYDEHMRLGIVHSPTCDANILGVVSDFVIRVAGIDCCVVYFTMPEKDLIKLSIRSVSKEVKASDIAREFTSGVGNGGGHLHKAGGAIRLSEYEKKFKSKPLQDFFCERYDEFINSCDLIYHDKFELTPEFKLYTKRKLVLGYVKTMDLASAGSDLLIRTFEGDVKVKADPNRYIMIGIEGEPYPITKEKFLQKYDINISNDLPYDIKEQQYFNKITNLITSEQYLITEAVMYRCRAKPYNIMAKSLERPTKVFTKWQYEGYMFGDAGDLVASVATDPHDIYIIKKDLFDKNYELVVNDDK